MLSVITVCYNEKEIERTCESVIGQTFQDFEWIVVDGGSTDGTLDILEKYKYRINKFISEPDKGIYDGMNKGIKLATGDWLNFMNGGDSFADKKVIEDINKYLLNLSNDVDIVYGDRILLQENSRYLQKFGGKINKEFFYNDIINHQATFIKKKLFNKFGLYNLDYKIVSDLDKWIVFAENGCKYQHISRTIACFDVNGVGSVKSEKHIEELKLMNSKHFTSDEIQYLEQKNKYSFWDNIFSIKNTNMRTVICFLGIKLKIKNR